MNIIYLRVSKQDLKGQNGEEKTEQQVLEDQLPPILKKFNLKEENCMILKEKGSAYDIDKINKRIEFLNMISLCFDAEKTTIKDLFSNNVKQKEISIYVFDSNRLMRNIELGMLFSILRTKYNVKLFSVNQDNLNINESDLIGVRMSKYLMGTVDSYLAEGYSQNISDHTKKKVLINKSGITISSNGNKWGKSLIRNGKPLSLLETSKIKKTILEMIKDFELRNIVDYYSLIIKKINKDHDIMISKKFIWDIKEKWITEKKS